MLCFCEDSFFRKLLEHVDGLATVCTDCGGWHIRNGSDIDNAYLESQVRSFVVSLELANFLNKRDRTS